MLTLHSQLVFRGASPEAGLKRAAAHRLLSDGGNVRLPLPELALALASSNAPPPRELLEPHRLTQLLSSDTHFTYSPSTDSIAIDAAALLQSGKGCLHEAIDRAWSDRSSSLHAWGCHTLASIVVQRQTLDMRPADLFTIPLDEAERLMGAAWVSRMELRDNPGPPLTVEELVAAEPCLEYLTEHRSVKIVFSALMNRGAGAGAAEKPASLRSLERYAKQGTEAPSTASGGPGLSGSSAYDAHVAQGSGAAASTSVPAYSNGKHAVDSAAAALQRAVLDAAAGVHAPAALRAAGSFEDEDAGDDGHGAAFTDTADFWDVSSALDGGGGDADADADADAGGRGDGVLHEEGDAAYDDEPYDTELEEGEEELPEDADLDAADAPLELGDGGDGGADAGAGRSGPGGYTHAGREPLSMRLDLLPMYVRAVFGGPSAADALMAVVALALVDAGRAAQAAAQQSAGGPPAGGCVMGGTEAAAGYMLPLSRLVTHVRMTAPHLLQAMDGSSSWHAGTLMQRLRERHSRGCFRVLLTPCGSEEEGEEATPNDKSEGEAVALDLSAFRSRVVEALSGFSAEVFRGPRLPDLIRRTVAAHLAGRTNSFAGRAHCVRLTTLSRFLAEALPDQYDPTRIGGLARMVSAESSGNVLHIFKKPPPGVGSHLVWGAAPPEGTAAPSFVSLNIGKLLAAAGVRDVESGQGRMGQGAAHGIGVGRASAGGADYRPNNTFAPDYGAGAVGAPRPRVSPTTPAWANPTSSDGQAVAFTLGAAPSEASLRQAASAIFPSDAPDEAAKRTAALSLVTALHSQPGGLMPLSRLDEIVHRQVPTAAALEHLLAEDPDLFELQEHWPGGPRGVRLRSAALISRASRSALVGIHSAPHGVQPVTLGGGSGHGLPAADGPLPQRPGVLACSYYMRYGTCGYGANCKFHHPPNRHAAAAMGVGVPVAGNGSLAPAVPGLPDVHRDVHRDLSGDLWSRPGGVPASGVAATTASNPAAVLGSLSPALQLAQAPQSFPALRHSPPAAAPASAQLAAAPPVNLSPPAPLAAAPAASPSRVEVKVVTHACTLDHLDMLQHAYAAQQVAIACKAPPAAGNDALATPPPCLVQLYAPAVHERPGPGASEGGHGAPAAPASGSPGATKWPDTVYLIDALTAGDKGALLLGSLGALLEDAAVAKVLYNSNETVPFLSRGCSSSRIVALHDVCVLHAMLSPIASAAAGRPVAPGQPAPSLGVLLQQHNLLTATGTAALAAAAANSPQWSVRPLSSAFRQQAVLEVVHLLPLWAALMQRLTVLPQQLSQSTADRLLLVQQQQRQQQQQEAVQPFAHAIAAPLGMPMYSDRRR